MAYYYSTSYPSLILILTVILTLILSLTLTNPHSCTSISWHWHGLSLLDFALFSEMAYYDSTDGGQDELQRLITKVAQYNYNYQLVYPFL